MESYACNAFKKAKIILKYFFILSAKQYHRYTLSPYYHRI